MSWKPHNNTILLGVLIMWFNVIKQNPFSGGLAVISHWASRWVRLTSWGELFLQDL